MTLLYGVPAHLLMSVPPPPPPPPPPPHTHTHTRTHTHTDTHLFTEEDSDTRRITFHTPFHYEALIRNASFALMYSIPRAHRLAREISSISSSLPLSPSSSVFVRCDIERLDVMKVSNHPETTLATAPSSGPMALVTILERP